MRIFLTFVSLLLLTNAIVFSRVAYAQQSCLQPPSEMGTSTLSVTLNPGTYRVWSRIKAADAVNNSYYLKIDDSCPVLIGDSPQISNAYWNWVDYENGVTADKLDVALTAGTHLVTLIGNEPGVGVDKILLTQDLSCIPVASGDNCPSELPSPIPTLTPIPTPTPTASPTPTPTPTQAIPEVQTLPSSNYLLNPSFENLGETWLAPWLFSVKNGARGQIYHSLQHADGKYSARISIGRASTDSNIRLFQNNLPLTSSGTYTLSFWAKASSKGNIRVSLQSNSGSNIYFQQILLITTSWQKYTFNFISPATDTASSLNFNLAEKRRDVYLDGPSLIRVE